MPLTLNAAFTSGYVTLTRSGEPNLNPGDPVCGGSSRSWRIERQINSEGWVQLPLPNSPNPYYDNSLGSISYDAVLQYRIQHTDTVWYNETSGPEGCNFDQTESGWAYSGTINVYSQADNSDPIVWPWVVDATPSTVYTSDLATVTGIDNGSSILKISAGGEYSKNGGAWASADTTIANGDTLRVRLTSAALDGQAAWLTANIGGTTNYFRVTNAPPPPTWSDTYVTFPSSGVIHTDKLIEVFGPQWEFTAPIIDIRDYNRHNTGRVRDHASNAAVPATASSAMRFPDDWHGARGYVGLAASVGGKSAYGLYPNNPSILWNAFDYLRGPWCEFYWTYTNDGPDSVTTISGGSLDAPYSVNKNNFGLRLNSVYAGDKEASGTITLHVRVLATGEEMPPITGNWTLYASGLA